MDGIPYDREHIASFFDDYGEREWERFDATPMDRVNLEAHLRFLREYVRSGDRVLDAGAGPGRFMLELARIGATVVAGDASPRMLELHAEKTAEVEEAIEARELLDIVDLGRYADESFDAVVCVMSLLGAARAFFDHFPDLIEEFGWERAVGEIFATRDLPADLNRGHVCRLYRWSDLERLFAGQPCRLVAASASNFLSVRNDAFDDRFLEYEIAACREPGALDGGTHILAALERI